jgi:hypothetical protein
MKKLGKISRGDWEHLRKIFQDTPPNCPYLVLTTSTKQKFGLSKTIDRIFYQVNLMHLSPPVSRGADVHKADPEDWEEAENTARQLLNTCTHYEPAD